jgi:small subunit ribosomal protein S3
MARGAHKVNPIIYRMGINRTWESNWFVTDTKTYNKYVKEDLEIRTYIEKELKFAGVAKIIINRSNKKVVLEIYVSKPGVAIGKNGAGIVNVKKYLESKYKLDFDIKLMDIKKPDANANLIAQAIALQCERRVAPKIAVQKAIDLFKEVKDVKGISIWVRGRIKGVDMARVEKYSWGYVPRHTLRAMIDYAFVVAQVPRAGKHGVKVWVNHGEKHNYIL